MGALEDGSCAEATPVELRSSVYRVHFWQYSGSYVVLKLDQAWVFTRQVIIPILSNPVETFSIIGMDLCSGITPQATI